jgi:hypothetical protein
MSIPCDKTFYMGALWHWCLTNVLKTLTLAISFDWYVLGLWHFTVSVPCDKTFPWVPKNLTLWPWHCCLTYIMKTLSMPIMYEDWYFTSVFCNDKSFHCVPTGFTLWPLCLTYLIYFSKTLTWAWLSDSGICLSQVHLCFTKYLDFFGCIFFFFF